MFSKILALRDVLPKKKKKKKKFQKMLWTVSCSCCSQGILE